MAYIFDKNGDTIDPAEKVRQALSANESGKGVSIRDTSTSVLSANSERIAATFINDSDEAMYLALGKKAKMNSGIRLNAGGGSFEINQTNLYVGNVSVICASGGKNLCVTEI